MSAFHRRAPPDAAEIKRIRAKLNAGVPWSWVTKQHHLCEATIRRLMKLNKKEK